MGHCHNVLLVRSPIEGMKIDQMFGQLNQLRPCLPLFLPHSNLTAHATHMSSTFTTTILNPNDELKNSIYFLVISNHNHGPNRSWSKLNHPTIGERQKKSSLLPRASSYAKGTTFTF